MRRFLSAILDAVAEARYRDVEREIGRMYGSTDLSDELERRINRMFMRNSSLRPGDDPPVD